MAPRRAEGFQVDLGVKCGARLSLVWGVVEFLGWEPDDRSSNCGSDPH